MGRCVAQIADMNFSSPGTRARLVRGERVDWIENHKRAPYVRAGYLALVPWADRKRIEELYAEARWRTSVTGRRHVVDHRIPLCRRDVCGLTVHNNLRVVEYSVNARESNTWSERCLELFDVPEQLSLLPVSR